MMISRFSKINDRENNETFTIPDLAIDVFKGKSSDSLIIMNEIFEFR